MAQAQFPVDLGTALADPGVAGAQLSYLTGMQGLQYRQDIAKSLLEDSDRPLSSGIGARGMPYRVSPLEALGRALSGGAGAYIAGQNVEAQKGLMQDYGKALGLRLAPGAAGGQPQATQPTQNPFVTGNNTGGQSAGDVISFIKAREDFSSKPYRDGKQISVGYGTKAQPGDENGITPEEGERRMRAELAPISKWIDDNVKVPLTQNQRTALTSFEYNTGAVEKLKDEINRGDWKAVADHMGQYIRQGNQVLPGLISRRDMEGRLLFQPDAKMQDRLTPQGAPQPAGQTAWHVQGEDDEAMRKIFLTDKPAWATVKAASIRANSPTELERALAKSGLPPADQQLVTQAWVREKAGLTQPKEGTQLVQGPGGQVSMQAIPGAAAAKGELEAAGAGAKKAAEQSAGYQGEIDERARNANDLLRTLSEMKNLNTNPGLFAGVKEDIGKFFRSAGVSDDTIQKYLHVSPGNLEASQKLTAQMAIEAVRQISNRPTQMEFAKFLEANPNIFQTPEGLKRVIEFMSNGANDTVNEQKAFYLAKTGADTRFPNGLRPENFRDFEQLHNIERQERIRQGQLNSTPATATVNNGLRGTIPAVPQQGGGAPPAAAQPAAPQGGPVRINSPQDVQRLGLKSGTPVLLPDGRVGTVP